jgi:hypothetical protein
MTLYVSYLGGIPEPHAFRGERFDAVHDRRAGMCVSP